MNLRTAATVTIRPTLRIAPRQLRAQAAILGRVIDAHRGARPLTTRERRELTGLWELAHVVLDAIEEER